MPEGDTIFRAAQTLRGVLLDRTILSATGSPCGRWPTGRAAASKMRDLAGQRVRAVEPRGKNLLIRFEDGTTLHTHMLMTGSWHVYPAGESWRKPQHQARIALRTDRAVAVCFSAPVVKLLSADEARRSATLRALGPDILAADFDAAEVLRRMRSHDDMPIGVALLTQRLIAGIGNVYKSEALFELAADPFAPVAAYDDEMLGRLLEVTRRMMRRNLEGRPRRTLPHGRGRYQVYGRSGSPCHRCGTRVRMRRQGEAARSTYYCSTCQRVQI